MTEFKPLEYAAAVAAFLLIVAYAAAYQWSALFRTQTRLIYAAPWHALLYLTGKFLGVTALMLSWALSLPYILTELWAAESRVTEALLGYKRRLYGYSVKGPLYHPQHAA